MAYGANSTSPNLVNRGTLSERPQRNCGEINKQTAPKMSRSCVRSSGKTLRRNSPSHFIVCARNQTEIMRELERYQLDFKEFYTALANTSPRWVMSLTSQANEPSRTGLAALDYQSDNVAN